MRGCHTVPVPGWEIGSRNLPGNHIEVMGQLLRAPTQSVYRKTGLVQIAFHHLLQDEAGLRYGIQDVRQRMGKLHFPGFLRNEVLDSEW